MFSIIWQTIKKPTRSLPALLVGFLIYMLIVLLPHRDTLSAFTQGESWTTAIRLAWGLLIGNAAFVGTGPFIVFLVLIFSLSISIALLIEVVVLKQDIKRKQQVLIETKKRGALASVFALLMTFFGYGCAACGTAISATIFNALGLSIVASWLPLKGVEFSLLGLVLVYISWRGLVRQIQSLRVPVCEIS
ncbi:MAG: hypothetical protein RIQ72_112 [Candidatus Parcubacteria bacterium]|jgi:hypothetical protein